MTDETTLMMLSPLDGRYAPQTLDLRTYFSEFAYIKYRFQIEIEFLIFLSDWPIIRKLTAKEKTMLHTLEKSFSVPDAVRIKVLEEKTRHDVKAIEYFLKEKLNNTTCSDIGRFVHFGLTSEDVNNIAYALMLSGAHKNALLPQLTLLVHLLEKISHQERDSFMVAKTHGQVAVPTTFGKELTVYVHRLKKMQMVFQPFRFDAKLNGAVGNYNALVFAYPEIDWMLFSKKFITSFDLTPNLITTQILPSDVVVSYQLLIMQLNTVIIGLCQDMWQYISFGFVTQKAVNDEVGSSTMPQKINPIDFENAEGNALVANSLFELYSRKLPISRLQRDLSDSTIKRTMGSAMGHTLIAWKSLERGLNKISFDRNFALVELNDHWEMLAEAMQIYFKLHGDDKGYEKVKKALRGRQIDKNSFRDLVKQFPDLAKLSPASYIGLAKDIPAQTRRRI